MKRRIAIVAACMLAACGGPEKPQGPAVVVYASENDPAGLPTLFAEFTAATGVPVSVVWGDAAVNAQALIDKSGAPADVLITPNVVPMWRAAEEGALRPIASGALDGIDRHLRDPDRLWAALHRRFITVAIAPESKKQTAGSYAALGAESYRGKLCVSSIENSVNRALIAMLIEDLGLKPAERLVRAWMMNLSLPPFETEAQLVEALESGVCQYGIVSASLLPEGMPKTGPVPLYADISAIGVGRHAAHPEKAQQLVDWLLRNHPPGGLAEWNGRNFGVVGWRDEDVRLLADRVGYR